MANVEEMAREALEAQSAEYINLIEQSTRLLASEKGVLENFSVEGRLVKVKPSGEAIIVGDLHGDFESLIHIMKASRFTEKAAQNKELLLVFLGDYGDRGPYSPEVYYTVLKLKQLFPRNVVLMRGNHEGPDDLLACPHDLPQNLQERFAEDGKHVYAKLRELYRHLYTAAIVERLCVLIHGGIPIDAASMEDLAYAHLRHPKEITLEEMLWSDPAEGIKGVCSSPRGAGRLFGEEVTRNFLETLGVKVLIRGHEPAPKGSKINHQGRVLTLFSRKGQPYFNSTAAYLQFDLSIKLQDAYDLVPYIHNF
jgi:protein phosphatase